MFFDKPDRISHMDERVLESVAAENITIMLVDDHPLVRQALRNLLESQEDIKVVAEATNGEEAVKLAAKIQPDIIIMDIGMPVMNGLDATRQIKAKFPKIAILVLTVHTDKEHVLGILEAGAAGYLTKVVAGDDVINAIRSVISGEAVLTPSILQQILNSVSRQTTRAVALPTGENLTPREFFILKLAARGMSNKDIASELNLSIRTVKGHLVDTFSKLGVGSRTEAVVSGLKSGMLTIDDLE